MPIDYDVAVMSERCMKDDNQDSFFCDEKRGLFIVADGASGCDHGEIASRIAVDSSSRFILSRDFSSMNRDDISSLVIKAIYAANKSVRDYFISQNYGKEYPGFPCTTLSIAVVDGENIIHGNVGDSRLYLVRADETPADKPVQRIKIFRRAKADYFGIYLSDVTDPDFNFVGRVPVHPSAKVFDGRHLGFLLCTDGFYKHFEWDTTVAAVESMVGSKFSVKTAAERPSFDQSSRNILGRLEKRERNGVVSLRYERDPADVASIIKLICKNTANDNVTVVYGLLRK